MSQRRNHNDNDSQHPLNRVIQKLRELGCKPKKQGKQWKSLCPAHDDHHPSLSVGFDNGRVLLKCFPGCPLEKICTAMHITVRELFVSEDRFQQHLSASKIDKGQSSEPSEDAVIDWNQLTIDYVENFTEERGLELCEHLQLPFDALASLAGIGWSDEGCWTFPERDGSRQVIGIIRRYRSSKKFAILGSKRGLSFPAGWLHKKGTVFIPEGASDVLAMDYAGLRCVGRPNNICGSEHLILLLSQLPLDTEIIVVGENDEKSDGSWPGRAGAIKITEELADGLKRSVKWTLPPPGFKDCRAWVTAPDQESIEWHDRGTRLSKSLLQNATLVEPGRGGHGGHGGHGSGQSEIILGPDEYRVNDEAIASLASEPNVYQRTGLLVRVVESESEPNDEGELLYRPANQLVIREFPPALIRESLTRSAQWFKLKKDKLGPHIRRLGVSTPSWLEVIGLTFRFSRL